MLGRRLWDLSEGIVVDAAHNTVTFHLSRPDPDFLYKLSMPFSFPVPSTTPMKIRGWTRCQPRVPMWSRRATNAYRAQPNPEFRPWNSPARPDGVPHRIIVKVIDDGETAVPRVLAGSLDWTLSQPSPETIGQLLTERPGQMHPTPYTSNWHMYLNTVRSPFDDVWVRSRELAVDRDRIAATYGGSGSSTCQILSPNFPAYEPYCPFTLDPGPHGTASDLERGRDLIEEAGAGHRGRGQRVDRAARPDAPLGPVFRRPSLTRSGSKRRRTSRGSGTTTLREYQGETQMALLGWFGGLPGAWGRPAPAVRLHGIREPILLLRTGDRRRDAPRERDASRDPAAAAEAWAAAERRLRRRLGERPPGRAGPRRGARVGEDGNYQLHPQWDVLLDQLWIV